MGCETIIRMIIKMQDIMRSHHVLSSFISRAALIHTGKASGSKHVFFLRTDAHSE